MRWALVVLLAACGSYPYSSFREDRQAALCAYQVRCGLFASAADCDAYYDRIRTEDRNTPAAIDDDEIAYSEDAAEDCVAAFASLSCDQTERADDPLAACNIVLRGKLVNEADCQFDAQCASGACYGNENCGMACCTGSCGDAPRLPGVGESCTALCEGDAYCGSDSICHAALPRGAACSGSSLCAENLYCAGASGGGTGACAPLPRVGEPCDGTCAEVGALCIDAVCRAAGLPGEACDEFSCSRYYECIAGTCATFPALGEPCTEYCSGNAWCSGDGTCVEQKPAGQPCVFNDECTSHYCADMVCADPPLCT